MATSEASAATPVSPRRRWVSAGIALAGGAVTFTSLYLAAGALTPLLVLYREQWGFAASLLTVAFAVYAIGFLAALLTVGSLSDHVGRRPALVEFAAPDRKRLGTILGSVGLTGGLALGSLLAGLAIQLTSAANTIIFAV